MKVIKDYLVNENIKGIKNERNLLRNDEKINPHSWVDYFVLSFCFKNRSYVDIITVFKVKNKDKRSSQECKVIFSPFLS